MTKSYCVIIRQLPNQIPVVTAVITEPENSVDDLDQYFKSEAEDRIQRFRNKFVEFNKATFYIQMFNLYGDLGVKLL